MTNVYDTPRVVKYLANFIALSVTSGTVCDQMALGTIHLVLTHVWGGRLVKSVRSTYIYILAEPAGLAPHSNVYFRIISPLPTPFPYINLPPPPFPIHRKN